MQEDRSKLARRDVPFSDPLAVQGYPGGYGGWTSTRVRELHLFDYLIVIRKHLALSLTFLLTLVSVVAVATYKMKPVYVGTAPGGVCGWRCSGSCVVTRGAAAVTIRCPSPRDAEPMEQRNLLIAIVLSVGILIAFQFAFERADALQQIFDLRIHGAVSWTSCVPGCRERDA